MASAPERVLGKLWDPILSPSGSMRQTVLSLELTSQPTNKVFDNGFTPFLFWIGELRGAFGSWVRQPRQLELILVGRVQDPLAYYQPWPGGFPMGSNKLRVRIRTQDQREHPFSRRHPWPMTAEGQQEEAELPSHTQEYDKGPCLTCKELF